MDEFINDVAYYIALELKKEQDKNKGLENSKKDV